MLYLFITFHCFNKKRVNTHKNILVGVDPCARAMLVIVGVEVEGVVLAAKLKYKCEGLNTCSKLKQMHCALCIVI